MGVSRSVQTASDYEGLLAEFRALPGRVERPRTFMEITRYPHYENVCSNILAFFMDPKESHGLGTLMLDALTSAGNIAAEGVWGNISVEREVITQAGNRIDILVTSDDHAILIENKIHASVINPFNDYSAYLDTTAGERRKHKLLLTLYPTSGGSDWGFRNLTHEEYVGHIRSLVGHYVSGADARHLTMFLDFLNTLENLRKGTRMSKEFVTFLAERSEDIESLSTELQRFRNELKEKVRDLQNLVDASHPSVKVWTGSRATLSYTSVHIINIAAEDLVFHMNTSISPHGWEIDFDYPNSKGDYSRLREFLQRLDIPFTDRERYGFVHPAHFAYDENLDRIRPILQGLVDKIATARN